MSEPSPGGLKRRPVIHTTSDGMSLRFRANKPTDPPGHGDQVGVSYYLEESPKLPLRPRMTGQAFRSPALTSSVDALAYSSSRRPRSSPAMPWRSHLRTHCSRNLSDHHTHEMRTRGTSTPGSPLGLQTTAASTTSNSSPRSLMPPPAGSPTFVSSSSERPSSSLLSSSPTPAWSAMLLDPEAPVPKTIAAVAAQRRCLDVALYESASGRSGWGSAAEDVSSALARTLWPNQQASVAARALIVRLCRSGERLAAAAARLEHEAHADRTGQDEQVLEEFERMRRTIARLDQEREVPAAVLVSELSSVERSHREEHEMIQALAKEELEAKGNEWRAEKEKLRDETQELEVLLRRTRGYLQEARERVAELETQCNDTEGARVRLQAHARSELEREKEEAALRAARADGDAASRIARAEAEAARLRHEAEECRKECEDVKRKAEEEMKAQRLSAEAQLRDFEVARTMETTRLQKEVKRLQTVFCSALAAGNQKCRQILYLHSLEKPVPRADDEAAARRDSLRSEMTWRDSVEIDELSAGATLGGGLGGEEHTRGEEADDKQPEKQPEITLTRSASASRLMRRLESSADRTMRDFYATSSQSSSSAAQVRPLSAGTSPTKAGRVATTPSTAPTRWIQY
jgi:hypothetical protein